MSPLIQTDEQFASIDLQRALNAWLPAGVHAVCTTREGGVSPAPFGSFNLGDHVQDDPAHVAENRRRLQTRLGGAAPIFLQQVHGTQVVALHANTPQGTVADACVTTDAEVACTIMVADCLPLLLTDASGRVVAAAHAGWRGLAAGVIEQTVHTMCDVRYQAMHASSGEAQSHAHHKPHEPQMLQARDLRVWLGPCIGPDAFEVGPEVREAFLKQHALSAAFFKPHPQHANKWLADLAGLARVRLQVLGIQAVAGNDSTSSWCTVTQRAQFFSYRRDGQTGRFAVCIWRSR
jgi:copper oxidase (laccase) domain-containing protein